MSRSAFSLITSRLSRAISSCSGFIWPWPGNACCGSSANAFTQLRSCVGCTFRSADACTYETPRSLISRTASSLNSRVNLRLSMIHLRLHKNTYLGVFEAGCRPDGKNLEYGHRHGRLKEALERHNRSLLRQEKLQDDD